MDFSSSKYIFNNLGKFQQENRLILLTFKVMSKYMILVKKNVFFTEMLWKLLVYSLGKNVI